MHWPSATLYSVASVAIIWLNKIALVYVPALPLLFFQNLMAVFLLASLHLLGCVRIALPTRSTWRITLLLAVLNVLNSGFGIYGTRTLDTAMFVALRRIGVGMTMVAEWIFLNKPYNHRVTLTVIWMLIGTIIAAADHLSFSVRGYTYVLVNNILTSAVQIVTKKHLSTAGSGGGDKVSPLVYSSILTCAGILCVGDPTMKTTKSLDMRVMGAVIGSVMLGLALNFTINWCVEKNGPLTLSMIGAGKNLLVGLLGCMGIIGNDYVFTWVNFIGLQIAAAASVMYVIYSAVDSKTKSK